MTFRRELVSLTPSPSVERAGPSQSTISSSKLFNCIFSAFFLFFLLLLLHDCLFVVQFEIFSMLITFPVWNCVLESGILWGFRIGGLCGLFSKWLWSIWLFVFLVYFHRDRNCSLSVWLFGVKWGRNVFESLCCVCLELWLLILRFLFDCSLALIATGRRLKLLLDRRLSFR